MGARCNVYLPIAERFMTEENTSCDKLEYKKIEMRRNSLKQGLPQVTIKLMTSQSLMSRENFLTIEHERNNHG